MAPTARGVKNGFHKMVVKFALSDRHASLWYNHL